MLVFHVFIKKKKEKNSIKSSFQSSLQSSQCSVFVLGSVSKVIGLAVLFVFSTHIQLLHFLSETPASYDLFSVLFCLWESSLPYTDKDMWPTNTLHIITYVFICAPTTQWARQPFSISSCLYASFNYPFLIAPSF